MRPVVGDVMLNGFKEPWYLDKPVREPEKPQIEPVKVKPGKTVLGHSGSWELTIDVGKNNA